MNYTKSKEQLLSEIRVNAYSAISIHMGNLNSTPHGSIHNAIMSAITEGIVEAFETLIENTYTDQQFEQDLKLNT